MKSAPASVGDCSDQPIAAVRARLHIGQRLGPLNELDRVNVIRGQPYLGEILLLSLAKAKGAEPDALRERAREWLADFSTNLP
ncbi:hypothetical protein [Nocardia salmonicida]|uniref:hypothetical protein n=1 Tax=Nocardia salmonicida TaxID=53431 RepID=UPI0033E3BA1E